MGHVACTRQRINTHRILMGKPEGRDLLEELGMEVWLMLVWIFKKCDVRTWTGLIWLITGTCCMLL
jgi:hypothetical protein